jgi:hypothetical protein
LIGRSIFLKHDLFGKPVSIFPDHALGGYDGNRRDSTAISGTAAISGARCFISLTPADDHKPRSDNPG